jgi:hypothetical protein
MHSLGQACRADNIPFIFELLIYPVAESSVAGNSYEKGGNKQAQWIIDGGRGGR